MSQGILDNVHRQRHPLHCRIRTGNYQVAVSEVEGKPVAKFHSSLKAEKQDSCWDKFYSKHW